MNKRKLQEFSSWAKHNLEKQIELSLKKIGINSGSEIKCSRVQGDVTIIEGIETTFKRQFHHQREEIIHRINDDGFNHTVEQFASTWFNRIIALRFLEVHDYLDHGFKLFPKEANTLPEILSKLSFVKDDLKLDMNYVEKLTSSGNNNEELYRYVLFQQCSILGKALPMLFSSGMDYLEHFIPTPLLFGDTIINKLIEIDEEDFKADVEIIGWLYQFYIATKKDEVFASQATITKETLPAATQLFTPDWIVKYLAENSIGRIWLESYPSSPLKSEMKYFVEEAKQEPEVEEKLKKIRYKEVNPEEIKIIEPCCGSGHILVYCFDLLLKIYLEKGYAKRDIPSLILKNNLVGLDIDQRATQLASFALVMRARSIDNKFFEEKRYVRPKVYEIYDSKALAHCKYNGKTYKEILKEYNSKQWIGENQLTSDEFKDIDYLVDLFDNAKIIGSLLKVNPGNYLTIKKKLSEHWEKNTTPDIFTDAYFDHEFKDLLEILRLAFFMSQKYDVLITNPPYMGTSGLEISPKSYLSKNFPDSKTDMFAMFMETQYVKQSGFVSMINMHSWMFLKSYERLREKLSRNSSVFGMIHLGARAFEEIAGEVVQTTSFVIRNVALPEYNGTYYRLVDSGNKEADFLKKTSGLVFVANAKKFMKIPGFILGFWASEGLISSFDKGKLLGTFVVSRNGMKTGENESFVRLWWEVDYFKSELHAKSSQQAINSEKKWFPYNKGGEFRRWYGNNDFLLNWQHGGKRIFEDAKKDQRFVQDYPNDFKFIPIVSWSKISTGKPAFRYKESCISDIAGMSLYTHENHLMYYLGFCNTKVPEKILSIIAPTLNFESGQIGNLPVVFDNEEYVNNLVEENVTISKNEWNSYETSWDFKKHPLLGKGKLPKLFSDYKFITESNFVTLKANEERLNEYFINLYGLQDELTKDVDDAYVSISIADKGREIKSLISYLISVLMGRYSLTEDGLIYAGGTFDPSRYGNHDFDTDGIIPIYSDISIEDGLVNRVTGLIKDIYGSNNYRENIDFIADALGKKSTETSEETLNRYLNDEFYTDHLKIYQKRPIYWMFSSGKLSGFKCLIYMHRYNQDTLAKINASYFQPATTILRNQIREVERQFSTSGDREKVQLERKRLWLFEQLNEAREYGQILDFMANKYLSIDLDDGVKVNYAKFQGIEIIIDGGKVKKDLLVPIK